MIGTLLLWLSAIIGGLVIILLVAPLRIRVSGWIDFPETGDYLLIADWAGGVFGVRKTAAAMWQVQLFGWPIIRFSRSVFGKRKAKRKKKKRSQKVLFAATGSHFSTMANAFRRMILSLFPKGHVYGRIGFSDPADTAMLAVFTHLIPMAGKRFQAVFVPAYDDQVFEGEVDVRIAVVPGYVLLMAAVLLLKKENRRMLHQLHHA
jgi:hypothetical protein